MSSALEVRAALLAKLKAVKTMPELDAMRLEVVQAMKDSSAGHFKLIQDSFIRAKNRMRRIPLKDRTW